MKRNTLILFTGLALTGFTGISLVSKKMLKPSEAKAVLQKQVSGKLCEAGLLPELPRV